jgi:succinoglycan biosynthesis protein ExoM
MLARALDGVTSQVTEDKFSFELVVVDNDSKRSGEDVVRKFQQNEGLRIAYDCEMEQNISLTRNRAVRNASGNLVAFIDDDEAPVKDWLYKLYHAMQAGNADGALGPVLPFYPPGTPEWLRKGNLFDRRRFPTGTRLTVRHMRTGNALLSRSLFTEGSNWFDPAFGRTGGEDVDFFRRQLDQGRVFVWCDEAAAYEMIPPDRWQTAFHFKKYFRIGILNGERLRKGRIPGLMGLMKTIITVPAWFIVMLISFPFGKHLWIRPALKLTYSGGCILAWCGFSVMRYRD